MMAAAKAIVVTRSKAEGVQLLEAESLRVLLSLGDGKTYCTWQHERLAVVHQPGNRFSAYDLRNSLQGQSAVVEMDALILESHFLSSQLLLMALKLDANTVQYVVFDVHEGSVRSAHFPKLPRVTFRDREYALFGDDSRATQIVVCRAGRTGLLLVDISARPEKLASHEKVASDDHHASIPCCGGQDVIQFARVGPSRLAVLIKGSPGNPNKCQVYDVSASLSSSSSSSSKHTIALLAERPFFKADRVDFVVDEVTGDFLVWCHTDSDASGANYYGENHLFLFSHSTFAHVPLDKAGPIHDVAWRPSRDPASPAEFIAVYGLMPSRVARFVVKAGGKMEILQTLSPDSTSVNTVKFQEPSGDYVLLGGFGNLPGKFELWSCRTGGRVRSALAAPGASRLHLHGPYLLAATVSPRLRVDNGLKLWDLRGRVVAECNAKLAFTELYNASILIPDSKILGEPFQIQPDSSKSSSSSSSTQPVKIPTVGKYMPPSMRGKSADLLATSYPSSSSVSELKRALDGDLPAIDNRPKPSKAELRIKRLQERLDQIAVLRDKQQQGLPLELNQLEKLQNEASIRQELAELMRKVKQ